MVRVSKSPGVIPLIGDVKPHKNTTKWDDPPHVDCVSVSTGLDTGNSGVSRAPRTTQTSEFQRSCQNRAVCDWGKGRQSPWTHCLWIGVGFKSVGCLSLTMTEPNIPLTFIFVLWKDYFKRQLWGGGKTPVTSFNFIAI